MQVHRIDYLKLCIHSTFDIIAYKNFNEAMKCNSYRKKHKWKTEPR